MLLETLNPKPLNLKKLAPVPRRSLGCTGPARFFCQVSKSLRSLWIWDFGLGQEEVSGLGFRASGVSGFGGFGVCIVFGGFRGLRCLEFRISALGIWGFRGTSGASNLLKLGLKR